MIFVSISLTLLNLTQDIINVMRYKKIYRDISKINSIIDYIFTPLLEKLSLDLVDVIYDNLLPNNIEGLFLIDLKNAF